jgi:deoxyribonuclease-1-like protein
MRLLKSKLLIILSIFAVFDCSAGLKICSWNLKDFGKSKSDQEINFIADIVKQYDVIAIQEVVAGYGGSQAVARLTDQLNRKGSKWDYVVSDPTSSSAYKTERYAFIWNTGKVSKKGEPWLEKRYEQEIDREPYYINLRYGGKIITLVNFHAITKSKQPETEVKYFKFLPSSYPDNLLLFLGDYNLPQSHTVFNPLKAMGYNPVFINQKTSLRQKCINNDCLASEFDNMFLLSRKVKVVRSGFVQFFDRIKDFDEARLISDHVPIYTEVDLL